MFIFFRSQHTPSSIVGLFVVIVFSIFSFSCKQLFSRLPLEERNQVKQFCKNLPPPPEPEFELYDKRGWDKESSTLYVFVYKSKTNQFEELKKHYADYLLPKGWLKLGETRNYHHWSVDFGNRNRTISIIYSAIRLPFTRRTYYVQCSAEN